MCNVRTFVRLCFGVSCDSCAGAIVLTSRLAVMAWLRLAVVSLAVMAWPWRAWPSCLGAVAHVSMWSMDMSPSCGCNTPTNASVCNVF